MPGKFWVVLLAGLMACVGLSGPDVARWHVTPAPALSAPLDQAVQALPKGAVMRLSGGAETLAALATVAAATPRTETLAGSVPDRRMTWVTRSAFWGFPDYTTAEIQPDGTVVVWARAQYGASDLGVNAARLNAWKAALQGAGREG